MIAEQNYGAHSAQVKMQLVLKDISLRITHLGPDYALLETPPDHPPCEASISMRVDDNQTEWRVRLPDGISKSSNRVGLAVADESLLAS
jgi:hypothetical protein